MDEKGLTVNFLMFHEVTKPHEEKEKARVNVLFQHPGHDGDDGKVEEVFDTGKRKSNLLTVAVLNKCQSENAASLFKSVRGLG